MSVFGTQFRPHILPSSADIRPGSADRRTPRPGPGSAASGRRCCLTVHSRSRYRSRAAAGHPGRHPRRAQGDGRSKRQRVPRENLCPSRSRPTPGSCSIAQASTPPTDPARPSTTPAVASRARRAPRPAEAPRARSRDADERQRRPTRRLTIAADTRPCCRGRHRRSRPTKVSTLPSRPRGESACAAKASTAAGSEVSRGRRGQQRVPPMAAAARHSLRCSAHLPAGRRTVGRFARRGTGDDQHEHRRGQHAARRRDR